MDLERALTHPYVIETIRAFGVLMVLSWHQVGFSERGNVQYIRGNESWQRVPLSWMCRADGNSKNNLPGQRLVGMGMFRGYSGKIQGIRRCLYCMYVGR